MTDRRSFITGMALAPLAITAPAIAAAPDPVDAYWAASEAYNADRISEEAYHSVVDRLDTWDAPTARDFARQFLACFDGGWPTEETMARLRRNAERLGSVNNTANLIFGKA